MGEQNSVGFNQWKDGTSVLSLDPMWEKHLQRENKRSGAREGKSLPGKEVCKGGLERATMYETRRSGLSKNHKREKKENVFFATSRLVSCSRLTEGRRGGRRTKGSHHGRKEEYLLYVQKKSSSKKTEDRDSTNNQGVAPGEGGVKGGVMETSLAITETKGNVKEGIRHKRKKLKSSRCV